MQGINPILPKNTLYEVCKTMKNGSGPSIFVPVHITDGIDDDMDMKVRLVLMDGIDCLKLLPQILNQLHPNQA